MFESRRLLGSLGTTNILWAAVALCAAWGCHREDTPSIESESKQEESTSSIAKTKLDPSEEPDAISLIQLGLEVPQPEDSDTHWDTELITNELNIRLKKLGERMTKPASLDPETLAGHVSEDFRCSALRPSNLSQVFSDEAFVIFRAEAQHEANRHPHVAAAGFSAALRELLAPAIHAAAIDVTFKIVGITASDDRITTTLLYQLRAPTNRDILQQNATWKCHWLPSNGQGHPRLRRVIVDEFEEVRGRGTADQLFSDCTETALGKNESYHKQLAVGLDYWLERIETRFGIDIAGWQGLAVADVNGDGLQDVYLCQGGGLPNRLFLQNNDGTVTDHSAQSNVDWRDHSHAALLIDLDNDSDQDLVLGTALGLIIMANDGGGTFETVAAKSIPESPPLSLSAADFDNDGDLDIFAACYSIRGGNSQKRRFLGRPIPYHDANNGGRNVLFRNDGQWDFRDVTQYVGLDQNNRRFSMAAAWEDYDNDGDLDLYVANDYGRNNLYRNDDGRFTDVAAEAGVEDISAGMSVSWGDFNRDGFADLYVSNMFSSAGNRIAYQRRFHNSADSSTRAAFQRHARGNSLFLNSGVGVFEDVSAAAGVTMGRWAWGSRFMDINNDGWDDLLVANGFITQADPSDL